MHTFFVQVRICADMPLFNNYSHYLKLKQTTLSQEECLTLHLLSLHASRALKSILTSLTCEGKSLFNWII